MEAIITYTNFKEIGLEQFAQTATKHNTWWPILVDHLKDPNGAKAWEYKYYLITLLNVLTNSAFVDLAYSPIER